MKTQVLFLLLAVSINLNAQVAINTDGSLPDNSAMLDVKSTLKGMLTPRMTLAQRNAITTPANGLIIFQTDNTPGYYFNSGTTTVPVWKMVGFNAGQWITTGNNIYYNTGSVGIGTNTPYAFLNIYGNTNSAFPHLLLTESEADYARLMFKNTAASSKSWSIAGGLGTTDGNSVMNFYYDNGSTGINILSMAGNGNMNISGNVGIGTTSPAALLHTQGTGTGGGNVVFVGEQKYSNPGNPPVSDYGTRMMWYPDKAAFRAGFVEGSHWDAPNVGYFSTAMGRNTIASGGDAIALGPYSIASGMCSMAVGFMSTAASSYCTALGTANIGGGNATTWVSTDPLFEIGNGGGTPLQHHNALTVLKNGYVGFGTATPSAGLHIKADSWPGSFIYLEANAAQDAGMRFYEGTTPKWHIYNNTAAGGLQITNAGAQTAIFAKQSNAFVGIGTSSPAYTLDVAGAVNLTKGLTGAALLCNGSQALWFDGTCFSWGYQGTYNYFANKITIGSSINPSYMLWVQGNAYTTGTWGGSDARFKKNITQLSNVLEKTMRVRGTSFEFRIDEFKDYQFDEGTRFGFIAQELEEVFPEVVKTENNGYKSVNYDGMIPVLLEAIKEQQKIVETQQKQIDELEAQVQKLLME